LDFIKIFSVLVSENILKHDNTLLAQRQVDNLDLPNESKKRADFIRHPDTVAKAEKIATDWLSMIERVRIIFQSLSQLRNKFSVSFCAGKL
jgi:hypothetical protein